MFDFDSQSDTEKAEYAIDGDKNTMWHTEWKGAQPEMPHLIAFDFGREMTVRGVRYVPRADGNTGHFAEVEFYCSNDPSDWGKPVLKHDFTPGATPDNYTAMLPKKVKARYLKVKVLSSVGSQPFASAAELDVIFYKPQTQQK